MHRIDQHTYWILRILEDRVLDDSQHSVSDWILQNVKKQLNKASKHKSGDGFRTRWAVSFWLLLYICFSIKINKKYIGDNRK